MTRFQLMTLCIALMTLGVRFAVAADSLTLVEGGETNSCIVVTPRVQKQSAEKDRVRAAARDLAKYLKKISGAEVPVVTAPKGDLLPIYLGDAADATPEADTEFDDAYVVDVRKDGIRLRGEGSRSTYYAAAHLLHELGVRWYGPGEIGECVPRRTTIRVEVGRSDEAPDFKTRNLWQGGRWLLRNRLGGPKVGQGHVFARIMGQYSVEEHPEYFPLINGQPRKHQVNMSNPEVVRIFADYYEGLFRQGVHSASFCPDDGLWRDERPETIAMNSGITDPIFRVPSVSEGFVKFGNAICEELRRRFEGEEEKLGYLGFYVYANYQVPPRTELDPMLLPIMAPIAFNRYTSIGAPNAPTSMLLESYTRGWAAKTDHIGCYLYNFNLADTAMPFTRRLTWSRTFPKLYDMGLRYATIESMPNWHTMVPGNYITARTLWDVQTDPEPLLEEFYRLYYGPAAAPMQRYNQVLEEAYENTHAYAGNLWGIQHILTPEVRRQLESAFAEARRLAGESETVLKRLKITEYSLEYMRRWFAAREAINNFKLAEAAGHSEAFLENYQKANAEFPGWFARYNSTYYRSFHHRSFEDAARVAEEGEIVYQFPDRLKAYLDVNKNGEQMGLYLPEASSTDWITLRTYSCAIAEQGFPLFRGLIWYRHEFELPEGAAQAGEVHLWFGGVDSSPHVWLNGRDLGRHRAGNFGPADIEVTGALNPTGKNVLVVACDNSGVTELGTGGIMRPVLIYRRK